MREEYLSLYEQVFTNSPVLFDGFAEVLADIEQKKCVGASSPINLDVFLSH